MMVLTVPVLILEKLTYSKETVNLVMAVQLVFYLLLIGILYFIKVNIVINGIIGWISSIIAITFTLVLSTNSSYAVNVVLLISIMTLIELSILKIRVFLSLSLAFMVHSRYQSFMDGLRVQISFIACIIGCLLAGVAIKYNYAMLYLLLALSIFMLLFTLYRRNVLFNLECRTR